MIAPISDFPSSLPLFFFNDTATSEIYTLSLHDALPICREVARGRPATRATALGEVALLERWAFEERDFAQRSGRSEEHTSELQSRPHLVCRLLLEKKKKN